MKIKQLMSLMVIMNAVVSLHAQPGIIDSITSKAKSAATSKVLETANQTVSKTLDMLLGGGLFKKKVKPANTDSPSVTVQQPVVSGTPSEVTQLIINNTDYSAVVALADIIKSNKNVKDLQRTFNNGSGVINMTHSCKPEDILDDVLKNASGKYEVSELSTGKIILKTKN